MITAAVHQGRVGYEWKTGSFSPYVEAGLGVSVPDGGDNDTFKSTGSRHQTEGD
ncbi:MAG: hypothetical protein CM15mV41_0330 [Caudoviricetes sp.]|nr:MAG: hypothetical protein CM15mV41_0330 [Caudoviricetes sp.]